MFLDGRWEIDSMFPTQPLAGVKAKTAGGMPKIGSDMVDRFRIDGKDSI